MALTPRSSDLDTLTTHLLVVDALIAARGGELATLEENAVLAEDADALAGNFTLFGFQVFQRLDGGRFLGLKRLELGAGSLLVTLVRFLLRQALDELGEGRVVGSFSGSRGGFGRCVHGVFSVIGLITAGLIDPQGNLCLSVIVWNVARVKARSGGFDVFLNHAF